MHRKFLLATLVLTSILSSGCIRNEPWRSGTFVDTPTTENINVVTYESLEKSQEAKPNSAEGKALVEVVQDENGKELFELNFIEFSERGNVFDSRRSQFVLDRLTEHSKKGAIVVVFIHGWKNNAATDNSNVKNFRKSLFALRTGLDSIGDRKVVGLFLGWRGKSLVEPLSTVLTYWDRKAVAEKVGHGGVTKLLLDLETHKAAKPENVLVVVGHSFGGAMLLSAYSEVLQTKLRLIDASENPQSKIADSIVLVNPAIEANEVLTLKEAVIRGDWNAQTPVLLEVISSKADWATHYTFRIGQIIGTASKWNQDQLVREYVDKTDDEAMKFLHEFQLDTRAVGNYLPFHTKEIEVDESGEGLKITDLCTEAKVQRTLASKANPRFPCTRNDPIQFAYTSKEFIKGHSDIFNPLVRAYLVTSVNEVVEQSNRNVVETNQPSVGSAPPPKADFTRTSSTDFNSKVKQTYKRLKSIK